MTDNQDPSEKQPTSNNAPEPLKTSESTPAGQAATPAPSPAEPAKKQSPYAPPSTDVPKPVDEGNQVQQTVDAIKAEVQKVIIGMDESIEQCLAAIFVDGHALLEGFPGVAKTLLVKLVARTLSVDFKRIQFTPDLMPADVIGTNIFNANSSTFSFHKGPVFSNFVLIDEINRAPAKTQAALFEVMEERQVTVEGTSHQLAFPFLVIATQNPIDQEGTYRLPEAQLDRFIFKIIVPYPSQEQEVEILNRFKNDFDQHVTEQVKAVANAQTLEACQKFIQQVHIEANIIHYITEITQATRNHESLYLGASPRASLALMKAAKAFAAMAGRNYVIPDDVQKACLPILNHRVLLGATAEMEGYSSSDLIRGILEDIEVPR